MSTRFLAIFFTCLFAMAPVAFAQKSDDQGARALEHAKLVEEGEHDLEKAARLYHEVATGESSSAAVRTRAWMHLGLCFAKLGRDAESRDALQKAVKGTGKDAERARVLLERGPEDEARLRARVNDLLQALRNRTRPRPGVQSPSQDEAKQELYWIGGSAVPLMIEALESEQLNLEFVKNVVGVLEQRPNSDVSAYLKRVAASGDESLKIAVIRGLKPSVDPKLGSAFLAFLSDDSPQVRISALEAAYPGVVDERGVLSMLGSDSASEVRSACIQRLVAGEKALSDPELVADFTALIRKSLAETQYEERTAALKVLRRPTLLVTESGREFYLEQLANPNIDADFYTGHLPEPFSAAQILKVATAVGAIPAGINPVPDKAAEVLGLIAASEESWDAESTESVLKLVDLGYDARDALSEWVAQNARREAALPIAERIAKFRGPKSVARALAELSPPKQALVPLAAELHRTLDDKDGARIWLMEAIVSIRTPEAIAVVSRAVEDAPELCGAAMEFFTRNGGDVAHGALAELVPLGTSRLSRVRISALKHLITSGVDVPARIIAGAYAAGMPSPWGRGGETNRPYRVPVDADLDKSVLAWLVRPEPKVDDARAAKVFDAVLATRSPNAWTDALAVADKVEGHPELLSILCRHVLQDDFVDIGVMDRILLKNAGSSAARQLAVRAINDSRDEARLAAVRAMSESGMPPAPEMRESLTVLLNNPETDVVSAAARVLARSRDESTLAALDALLENDDSKIRELSAQLLSRVRPERALTLLVERTKKEPDVKVLATLYRRLGDCLDHRAVPMLLEAMRHPSSGVRKSAAEALVQIREYYDHKDHFKHLARDFDLRSEGAAEMLLQQASEGSDKKQRIAALHSLGTLAVPETLPFLIKMMQESDTDIAKAAEKAVTHINKGVLGGDD